MVVKGNVHCNNDQLLNANLDIDVFAKKSQKITVAVNVQKQELPEGRNLTSSIEVNSRGQQLKLDLKSHLTISTKQIGLGNFFTYNDVKQKPKTLGALFSADTSHVYLFVTLPDKELIKDDWKLDISKNKQKIYRELSLLGEAPCVMSYEANNLNPFKFEAYFKGKFDILHTFAVAYVFKPFQIYRMQDYRTHENLSKNLCRRLKIHLNVCSF